MFHANGGEFAANRPRRRLLAGLGAGAASLPLGRLAAQPRFPGQTIRFVVPFPAGGTGDVFTRTVGQHLSESLGQPVIIENRPGASTIIGTQQVVRAVPDGHTLLATSSSLTTLPIINRKLPFDVTKDLAPIAMPVRLPVVLAADIDAPFDGFRSMVAFAKAHPGKLNIGVSPGQASISRFVMELLKLQAGIDFVIIPYAGGSAATTALFAKEIHCLVDAIPASAPFIKQGRMRGLAVLTPQRTTGLPEIPTIVEEGVPELVVDTWFGILAPAGTPSAVVQALHGAIMAITGRPDVRDKFIGLGMEPQSPTPAQFGESIGRALATWTRVARTANLQFE